MKKSRPGTMLTVLCRPENSEKMASLLFKHTTTLGIRRHTCRRYTLERTIETAQTPYGPVRIKHATGWGVERMKPEYEDLAELARKNGKALEEIRASMAK